MMKKSGDLFRINELEQQRQQAGKSYLEFLRTPAMSAGVYRLAASSVDEQKPHAEDEMYYVLRGRARMKIGTSDQAVSAGDVIFVAAEVAHRFYDIAEELVVLVFFAPAES
jgi:mannose-6-phosphate isomerase-like protein (cupin superfamily)